MRLQDIWKKSGEPVITGGDGMCFEEQRMLGGRALQLHNLARGEGGTCQQGCRLNGKRI